MEQFICNLACTGVPIVFKGGSILKIQLQNLGLLPSMARETVDVDADWVSEGPSMEFLEQKLDFAAKCINPDMYAVTLRPYGICQCAQFAIALNNEIVFSVDISVHPNNFSVDYYTRGLVIHGQSSAKTVADKVAVISSRRLYARTKDMYDLYVFSFSSDYYYKNILNIIRTTRDEPLGNFRIFLNSDSRLRDNYSHIGGIQNKPSYETVYSRVHTFLEPFIRQSLDNYVWNGSQWIPLQ